MTVSQNLIDRVESIRTTLNEISVYNLDVKTAIELYYELAKKVNEVINELSRFEGVVSEEVVKQNEKLLYLLGEGLKEQVVIKIDELITNGTIQDLINNKIFSDLNTKIETFKQQTEEQFNTIATLKLISDLDSTNYKINDYVDIEKIRTLQATQYALFFRKLRKKESVQICCMGNSLTNGQDTISSDKRPVSSDLTHVSGEPVSSQTIASVTYPEALRNNLKNVYGNQVNVINRGYSGDWVKAGYQRYNKKHSSDLTIIMYGTNDSRASWVPDDIRGNIEEYIKWYEQLIIREVLWGKGVIILKSPKLPSASDIDVDAFRNALDLLGEKYGIPVVDSEEFMRNYDTSIYCDNVHFNGVGYSIFGAKVTALLMSENIINPLIVGDGTKLLTRPTIDNITFCGTSYFDNETSAGTPNENLSNKGIVARIPDGQCVIYSFYSEVDDLVIFPYSNIVASDGKFFVELDFGKQQPKNSLDGAIYASNTLSESNVSYTTYNGLGNYSKVDILNKSFPVLRISGKGWHVVKITSTGGELVLNGLEFMSYENYKQMNDIKSLNDNKTFYYGLSHDTFSSSPTQITSITINKSELLKQLRLTNYYHNTEHWRNMPLKITVFNYGQSIIEYVLLLGSLVDGSNSYLTEYSRKNLVVSPNEATITSVIVNATTVTLNLGGSNRVFSFNIQLM